MKVRKRHKKGSGSWVVEEDGNHYRATDVWVINLSVLLHNYGGFRSVLGLFIMATPRFIMPTRELILNTDVSISVEFILY
jgi:hypothetical protein